ncbi:hypothetical protein OROMI_009572 [Orobanche minor]
MSHTMKEDMYEGASTSVRSALSPFLFAIVMDELTRGIQNDVPWCMMFADDIVLIDETKVGVQQKLELWRDTLEARGFRLSRSKTEYMECRFSDNSDREAGMITFDGKVVHGSNFFRYLGSIIQKGGEIDGDVMRITHGCLICPPLEKHPFDGFSAGRPPHSVAAKRLLKYLDEGVDNSEAKRNRVEKNDVWCKIEINSFNPAHFSTDRKYAEIAIRSYAKIKDVEYGIIDVLFAYRKSLSLPKYEDVREWCHVSFIAEP